MLRIEELAEKMKKLIASVEEIESGRETVVELFSTEDAKIEDITAGKTSYRVKVTIKTGEKKKIMNWVYDSENGELHFMDQNSGIYFSLRLVDLSRDLPSPEL